MNLIQRIHSLDSVADKAIKVVEVPHAFFPTTALAGREPLIHKELFQPFDLQEVLARFTVFVSAESVRRADGSGTVRQGEDAEPYKPEPCRGSREEEESGEKEEEGEGEGEGKGEEEGEGENHDGNLEKVDLSPSLAEHGVTDSRLDIAVTEACVAVSLHHLVTDGTSELLLLHEFMQLLTRASRPDSLGASHPDFLPPTVQFVDVIRLEGQKRRSGREKRRKDQTMRLWADTFQSAPRCTSFPPRPAWEKVGVAEVGVAQSQDPVLVAGCTGEDESYLHPSPTSLQLLPAELPLWAGRPIVGEHCYQLVPAAVTSRVRALARAHGVSTMIVVVTSLAAALSEFLGERDIVVGVACMNRTRDSQRTHGYLASILPLRVDFSASKELGELLKNVRRNWSLILDGGVDLADLVPILPCLQSSQQSPPDPSLRGHSPLQVLFSYYESLPPTPPVWTIDGVKVRYEWAAPRPGHTHVDLVLEGMPSVADVGAEVLPRGRGFRFNWDYRTSALTLNDVKTLSEAIFCFIERAESGCGHIDTLLQHVSDARVRMAGSGKAVVAHRATPLYSVARGIASGGQLDDFPFEFGDLAIASAIPSPAVPPTSDPVAPPTSDPEAPSTTNPVAPPTSHPMAPPTSNPADTGNQFYFQRFESKARSIPTAPLFKRVSGDIITYGEVLSRVTCLASLLYRCYGVRPGHHVGVHMARSPRLYTTILAVLKLAAAYVPIALQNPSERAVKMLTLADARLLLTESNLAPRFVAQYSGRIVSVDVAMEKLVDIPPEIPPGKVRYHADQIFYIIFTSGTTGDPKGVAVTNGNMAAGLAVFEQMITPRECRLTVASINVSFDPHVLDSLAPMLLGACLMVVDNITHIADPAYAEATYALATASSAAVTAFPRGMQAMLIGGEAFTMAAYESTRFVPKVLNCYGPTECTITSTVQRVRGPEDVSSIGVPPSGVKVMVLDQRLRVVPIGQEGILHVGGPVVSTVGYYHDDEKTGQSFFPNPYAPRELIYCTGDLARMRKDGALEFIGRRDDQVKLRGMRLQLSEVERALSSHATVRAAAVVVDQPGQPAAKLVGFVTPASIDTAALLRHASLHVPSYMVPSVVCPLDSMPLTRQGKTDRRALAAMALDAYPAAVSTTISGDEPDGPGRVETGSAAACRHEEESTVAKIARVFAQVLGTEDYAIGANFFASGGHSLLTFQLQRQVNAELGSSLTLADVLQHPTPAGLAALLRREGGKVERETATSKPSPQIGEGSTLASITRERTSDTFPKLSVRDKTAPDTEMHGGVTVEVECRTSEIDKLKISKQRRPLTLDYLAPVPATPISPELSQEIEAYLLSTEHLRASEERSRDGWSEAEAGTARHLCDRLRKETGFSLPPHCLPHCPSLARLHAHLKLKTVLSFQRSAESPTLVLRPPTSPDEEPIFFVHGGVIGWPLPYLRLAQELGRYSVAVQFTALAPTTSLEDMAAYYVAAVRAVQRRGPYVFVGVCYGALLVFEMVRQLGTTGETVELAVLVNNSPINELRPEVFDCRGVPLVGTPLDPTNFFHDLLGLEEVEEEEEMKEVVEREEVREKEEEGEKERIGEEGERGEVREKEKEKIGEREEVREKEEEEGENERSREEFRGKEEEEGEKEGMEEEGEREEGGGGRWEEECGVRWEGAKRERNASREVEVEDMMELEVGKKEERAMDRAEREEEEGLGKTQASLEGSVRNLDDVVEGLHSSLPHLPFSSAELKQVFLTVLGLSRCVWHAYRPQPVRGLQSCVLLRCRRQHPLFHSHDYGLGRLVGADCLSVIVPPEPLGLLSEDKTVKFVGGVIEAYLGRRGAWLK